MRKALLVLCALGAAALLAATATASSPSVTPIRWNAAKQGGPSLVVGQHSVWVEVIPSSAGSGAPSVWRVDPADATVHPTPITAAIGGLFPGIGTLWVARLTPGEGNRLIVDWVDVRHGFRLVPKVVPKSCGIGDGGHSVVYGGRLWLTCAKFGVYVYAPDRAKPIRRMPGRAPAALLMAARGVWVATGSKVRAISGPDKGANIAFPHHFHVAGDYASNVGWAVAGSTIWAIGRSARGNRGHPELVRIDLKRRTSRAYRIVVPGAGFLGGGIAIAGNEIWFGDEPHARLIRYSQSHPDKPLGYVALPGHGIVKDGYLRLQGGAGAVWVEVERPDALHLLRVATH